jgi:DNA-binding NtrC family response regulator
VKNGTFREDLFHRLKVFPLNLPPLRSRGPEDLGSLVTLFMQAFQKKLGKASLSISPEATALLRTYSWPGNIRELQNALSSAALLSEGVILPEHLPMSVQGSKLESLPKSPALDDVVRRVELEHIGNTLKETGGDVKKAAKILGLDEAALSAKIKSLGLK